MTDDATDDGTEEGTISLLVVDDHPVVRDGLRGMFESAPGFRVLGEASNGVEAVGKAAALDPDVILMDLRMPGGGGVEAIAHLTRAGARAKVLVLTTYDTDSDTIPAIEAGATGYLLKDAPRDELFTAVRAAAQGRTVLSPAVASRLVSAVRTPRAPGNEPLSAREREVLDPGRQGHVQPRDRPRTLHQRGDGEDPPHPPVRQAGRQGPGGGGGDGLRPGDPGLIRPTASPDYAVGYGSRPSATFSHDAFSSASNSGLSGARSACSRESAARL